MSRTFITLTRSRGAPLRIAVPAIDGYTTYDNRTDPDMHAHVHFGNQDYYVAETVAQIDHALITAWQQDDGDESVILDAKDNFVLITHDQNRYGEER